MAIVPFNRAFVALTGNAPFPWQEAMYGRFAADDIPSSCDLPTGLGKTAVMAIWLIALANGLPKVPRRLVYVVNRRTVVDQATAEAEKLRHRLKGKADLSSEDRADLGALSQELTELSGTTDEDVLAISTLRGQFADYGQWSADPARPAVIVGTVDMIGSRLLFSGYRIGFKSRPLHAGFLGQDALLVHDEAHLEPAFQKLLVDIEREQKEREGTGELPWSKLRVMALSATTRAAPDGVPSEKPFELTAEEARELTTEEARQLAAPEAAEGPIHHVWRRLRAKKTLELNEAGDAKDAVAKEIARLATGYRDAQAAVLVFVRTLEEIATIEEELDKTKRPILLLTGTMRGKERDEFVEQPVFKRFLRGSERGETVYLLCTSAGEVGIDMSADHMVCDLSTFESMAQRFGRVNRFGDGDSRIDVAYPSKWDEKDRLAPQRQATLKLLKQLEGDACPAALRRLDPAERAAAYAPEPTMLPATDILFDAWALTSVRGRLPGRPPVAPYLHGIAEWQPAETYVAWRVEVELLTDELLKRYPPEDLLEEYPLKPRELLRDRSDRVFETLKALSERHPTAPAWVIGEEGDVEVTELGKLADPSATAAASRRPLVARIESCTVLLPPSVGGLNRDRGTLDAASTFADDVADIDTPESERRMRLWANNSKYDESTEGMRLLRSIDLSSENDEEETRTWDWFKQKPAEDSRTARKPVCWDVHVNDAASRIGRMLNGLLLPEEIAAAVRLAVRLHDHGKRRAQFQAMLGNRAYPSVVWAKSGRTGARLPETYRHEFGSLADAAEDPDFRRLSPEMQELVLHLIAAHHGRGRPHFPAAEAFDPVRPQADADRLACEVPRRFSRLQRKYGRWGLAYLESLVRAADWAASADPSAFATAGAEVSQ